MKNITFSAALLAGATTVHAEQMIDGAAVATGMQTPVTHVIAEGHIVMHIQSAYEAITTSDPASTMNGTSGTCFGSLEIITGTPAGSGKCVFSDAGGDMITNTWTV